jgi:hypothetical protein
VSVLRSLAGWVLLSGCGGCRQARNSRSSLVTRKLRLAKNSDDGDNEGGNLEARKLYSEDLDAYFTGP